MSEVETRSIPQLISAVAADLSDLVRKESELIRAEVAEKMSGVVKAGAAVGVGAVVLLGGFLCFLACIVIALSNVMPTAWAALLVAVVCSLIGFTLLRTAQKTVQGGELTPRRSAQQLRKDAQLIKEEVR